MGFAGAVAVPRRREVPLHRAPAGTERHSSDGGSVMLLQRAYLGVFAVVLATQVGCTTCHSCWPCGDTWCGSQCGQCIWSEWYSMPPKCCDPCDCCGNFVASRNPWVRRGGPPMGRPCNQGMGNGGGAGYCDAGMDYGDGGYSDGMGSADATYTEGNDSQGPAPAEELPHAPPGAGMVRDEFGQTAGYSRPVDSPAASRRLGDRRPQDFDR